MICLDGRVGYNSQVKENFWQKLKTKRGVDPIVVLAPMADVTDAAFRRVIAKYGKPDVMWTEFVSADGLFLADSVGQAILKKDLIFTDAERPIVAQFFTARPEMMKKAAALAREMGFDGVDINMGCPVRTIEKQGAGAALIKNPKLAREIIMAAKEGAADLPVSIKTRIGFNKNELDIWLPELLAAEPAMITIHARTRKEMSKVPARWEEVKRGVEIRDRLKSNTLIFGNGDVMSVAEAKKRAREAGCDGVMMGRAIFGNPWLFDERDSGRNQDSRQNNWRNGQPSIEVQRESEKISIKEKLDVMVKHTKLFEELLGNVKNFAIMKKHYKAYVTGWDGAKELRMKLMATESASEVEKIVQEYEKTL